tara:strand:+ start:5653 stop:5880 length:228 start_codon:yes stop_codon:yes gene_type:complete
METKFREIIAEVLEVTKEEVDVGIKLDLEGNWDSIAHLSFISAIDSTFDIQLDGDDLLLCDNTSDLINLLNKYND